MTSIALDEGEIMLPANKHAQRLHKLAREAADMQRPYWQWNIISIFIKPTNCYWYPDKLWMMTYSLNWIQGSNSRNLEVVSDILWQVLNFTNSLTLYW